MDERDLEPRLPLVRLLSFGTILDSRQGRESKAITGLRVLQQQTQYQDG